MDVGVIGLGRMGRIIAQRLRDFGHRVFGFDKNLNVVEIAKKDGIFCTSDLSELTTQTDVFWIMVPAGESVENVIKGLVKYVKKGSIIIDGGNSNYRDSIRRYQELKLKKIDFVDCGTSGGLHGQEYGFSLMIGGEKSVFDRLELILKAVAAPQGYGYMGPAGAGHYVKMVHNGIEYALLQAYAEGFHILKDGLYKNLNLEKISDVWNHGSVIRSWILELINEVFEQDQDLKDVSGQIGENLTGRWAFEEAKRIGVPVDLIERALEIRTWSRQTGGNYATKLVAMLRSKFGGHPVKKRVGCEKF